MPRLQSEHPQATQRGVEVGDGKSVVPTRLPGARAQRKLSAVLLRLTKGAGR
jgi:hypothetical protein